MVMVVVLDFLPSQPRAKSVTGRPQHRSVDVSVVALYYMIYI